MGLNDDGTADPPELLTTIDTSGAGGALDGLAVDICANAYVVQMKGAIWRISPDGHKELAVDVSGGQQIGPRINAANFGSGKGGWKRDALYLISMSLDTVYEVEVGVPGAPQPHLQ
jgi:sugar lactone lactonase YvrE